MTLATVFRTRCSKCNPSAPWAMQAMLVRKMILCPSTSLRNGCFWVWAAGSQPRYHLGTSTHDSTLQRARATISDPGFYRFNTWRLQLYMVLIHAIHNVKGLSNVKSLAKSSKNIFIWNVISLRGPLTREIVVMTTRISIPHKGSLTWNWFIRDV